MHSPEIPKLLPRMERGPAVTVVMPTYRRAGLVGDTIRSLLGGLWRDFELLVRDDGDGTDGTREAVAVASAGDSRVRYHLNPQNLGMPGNLNAGIAESRGDFIAVCHDHDLFNASFLELLIAALRRHPTAMFVHCAIETITENGKPIQRHVGDWSELTAGSVWLRYMLGSLSCPVCALTIVRREAHEMHGLYDPECGFIADVEMWMRLSSVGDVAYVPQPLVQVREREAGHEANTNGDRFIRQAAQIHRRFIPSAYDRRERALKRLKLEMQVGNQCLRHYAARVLRG